MITPTLRTLAIRISSRSALLSCLTIVAASVVLSLATPAQANHEPAVTVPIQVTVVPGQPTNLFFTEQFDPIEHKDIIFEGIAQVPPGTVGVLDVQFDWLDPSSGGFLLSPVFSVQVIGGAPAMFTLPWTIPFCPSEISLHLATQGGPAGGVPIQVDGTLTYQCVPEPSTFVLLGLALVSSLAYGLRKRFA